MDLFTAPPLRLPIPVPPPGAAIIPPHLSTVAQSDNGPHGPMPHSQRTRSLCSCYVRSFANNNRERKRQAHWLHMSDGREGWGWHAGDDGYHL